MQDFDSLLMIGSVVMCVLNEFLSCLRHVLDVLTSCFFACAWHTEDGQSTQNSLVLSVLHKDALDFIISPDSVSLQWKDKYPAT